MQVTEVTPEHSNRIGEGMAVEYCDLAVCTGRKSLTALNGFRALFHIKHAEALKGCQPWILLVFGCFLIFIGV